MTQVYQWEFLKYLHTFNSSPPRVLIHFRKSENFLIVSEDLYDFMRKVDIIGPASKETFALFDTFEGFPLDDEDVVSTLQDYGHKVDVPPKGILAGLTRWCSNLLKGWTL